MIVLDASVVVAQFAVRDAHSAAAFEILDTDDDLAIHAITLAESLVRPVQEDRGEQVSRQIEMLGVVTLPISPDEPLGLAHLRASTHLKLPDCCVLAAALRESATLATFDSRLADVARGMGVEVVGAA